VLAYRQTITFNWTTLAEAEKRLGHTSAAADALRERVKLWPDDPKELFRTARDLLLVAEGLGPDEEAERRRDHEDALALLRQAVARGFRDVARLQQDKALDPLRSQEGFRELIRELEKRTR
jgi:hypothetical protein